MTPASLHDPKTGHPGADHGRGVCWPCFIGESEKSPINGNGSIPIEPTPIEPLEPLRATTTTLGARKGSKGSVGVEFPRFRGHLTAGPSGLVERMSGHAKTPPYSKEFRAEAVRLLKSSGRPIAQLARELGCSEQSLRNCRARSMSTPATSKA
jgi:hypothetical protein